MVSAARRLKHELGIVPARKDSLMTQTTETTIAGTEEAAQQAEQTETETPAREPGRVRVRIRIRTGIRAGASHKLSAMDDWQSPQN